MYKFRDLLRDERSSNSFKVFHELIKYKVSEILLVSSPYDAYILEEEGQLAARIIDEYQGLNLSKAPKLTWVSTVSEALDLLSSEKFDLVITMPYLNDMSAYVFCDKIKRMTYDMPVFLLTHNTYHLPAKPADISESVIDKIFIWKGNADLLLAMIKYLEDKLNVDNDTACADVRVIIYVEDSPYHTSSILPILYKEIVTQTHAVMDDSLNAEHKLLRMRARPKIVVADNFEDALDLYNRYKPYLMAVFSDVCYKKGNIVDKEAGIKLLSKIRQENIDLPLLAFSTDEENRVRAEKASAGFINKNLQAINEKIRSFFINELGFGDFIFKRPDGSFVARAADLKELEKKLAEVPDESIAFHTEKNDFSKWLLSRSEVPLALKLYPVRLDENTSPNDIRQLAIDAIHQWRMDRQRGIILDFSKDTFEKDTDFIRIGKGSLGGKGRGLAFISSELKKHSKRFAQYKNVSVYVPKTCVITTSGFDAFVKDNELQYLLYDEYEDAVIIERFTEGTFPRWLKDDLTLYLEKVTCPLAVRSSSLQEDEIHHPSAGLYKTFMLPNNHQEFEVRLDQLIQAVKMIYASTYLKISRSFAKNTSDRTEEEKMAVILQELTGTYQGDYFYPALSGVLQTVDYYPIADLHPEDGVAHIALGLGKTVVEGEKVLRFSPKSPKSLPHFSRVEDILKNSQTHFYALKMDCCSDNMSTLINDEETLVRIEINEVKEHEPIQLLSSTFMPQDNRIRDSYSDKGFPVMAFANLLKYNLFPFDKILMDLMEIGRNGMGSSVEMEFAVNLTREKMTFTLLQIRPMSTTFEKSSNVNITTAMKKNALAYSTMALGNGTVSDIRNIIYVSPSKFELSKTVDIAQEIRSLNSVFVKKGEQYILIGPGRWGTADRWLGIPVKWGDITAVQSIFEYNVEGLNAEPSQGSHFFHNITTLGISYVNIIDREDNFLATGWLEELPVVEETTYLKHIKLTEPLSLLVDGKTSHAVLTRSN